MCAQTLKEMLVFLKRWLYEAHPSSLILYYAKILMNCYDRDDLPDWVEILANGSPDKLADVLDVARADIKAEEDSDASHNDPNQQS